MTYTMHSRRKPQALILMIAGLLSTGLAAREIVDATGRNITLPERIARVMAAGP